MTMERPDEQVLELREEELHVHRELRDVGEAQIRTRVEQVPARLEVDSYSEEVHVEHVPIGRVVTERAEPHQDGDVLVVPMYEEQLVVTKRLLLREELRIRRVKTTQHQMFEDTLRRERAEIDDPNGTGLVHERYPDDELDDTGAQRRYDERDPEPDREEGGLVNLVRRALQ
jgi:uncharacterized protein (TIGR02271 family)